MDLMGGRVSLTPRPALARAPALEAGMLGHLPGRLRLERLRGSARSGMRAAGWGEAVDHLEDLARPRLSDAEIARVRALHHVPVPLHSSAELDDLFPDARVLDTAYRSVLAGAHAWLPPAVDDFFANGGERLWIIRIPESEGRSGFLPSTADTSPGEPIALIDPMALRGLACVLPIPEVGVVAAPDLERLGIPARLRDIPPLGIRRATPAFAPSCPTVLEAVPVAPAPGAAREQSDDEPDTTLGLLDAIQRVLARLRPDIQYLHTLPLEYSNAVQGPAVHAGLLDALETRRLIRAWAGLKRVQLLFPYLRRATVTGTDLAPGVPRADLVSPVGLIAGRQAEVARRDGIWRSVAGQALVTECNPYPPTDGRLAERLRERPGVGVLVRRQGRVELDDERLAVPALHPDDYLRSSDPGRFDGYRSGEIARFIGWLLRRLRGLGETLIFDLDPADPRPRLLLEDLFRRLHAAGALRGAVPEESFRIRPGELLGNGISFDIEIAPAFPVDRLRLSFANTEGEWRGRFIDTGPTGEGGADHG